MGRLIYTGITSLDGYTADSDGQFDWSVPDEEVHTFVNDLERDASVYLYGRRMYEVMSVWQTIGVGLNSGGVPPVMLDYADVWRAAEKVVYSTTLDRASTPRTRIAPHFDVEEVRRLKADTGGDISIGGADVGGQALAAGLVDVCRMLVSPMIVGGGTAFLPPGVRTRLDLIDQHRFSNGVVYMSYRVANAGLL